MIFRPEVAQAILDGHKTVMRRRRTGSNPTGKPGGWLDEPCRYKVGRTYAIQPGPGKKAIGRIRVTGVRPELMTDLTVDEARREGFAGIPEFIATYHGRGSWLDIVWRIEFVLEGPGDA